MTNLLGSALPMLVVLISVPLYLNIVGVEKYGILSLVWIVFGYFGILDFGVSRAVTSAISRVRHDADRKAEIIWSAAALGLTIGVIIALAGGLVFFLFAHHSSSPVYAELLTSLPLMMVGIPVLMITSTLSSALDGEERFKTANAIQVVGSALYQLVPLGVAYAYTTEISHLVDAVIFCRIIVMLLFMIATSKAFELMRRRFVTMKAAGDLIKFGSTVAIINVIDPIFSRIDQLIIANFSGSQGVAAYNIAVNSIVRLSILPTAMSRSLYPKLSTGTIDDFREELYGMKSKVIGPWLVICVAAILASDLVFRLWLHNAIAPQVSDIAKIFVVGLWANCLSILPYTALQASGQSGSIIKAHLIEMPFYLVALVGLTHVYGPVGAAAAWGMRNFVDYIVLWKMCHYPIRKQGLFACLFLGLSVLGLLLLPSVRAAVF